MDKNVICEIRKKIKAELPQKLKNLRVQNKYTQKYVAEKLGISVQSYLSYEKGKTLPKVKNAIKLANLYDVSMDFLIGDK